MSSSCQSNMDVARPPRPAPTTTILNLSWACGGLASRFESLSETWGFLTFCRNRDALDGYDGMRIASGSLLDALMLVAPSMFARFALRSATFPSNDFKILVPFASQGN